MKGKTIIIKRSMTKNDKKAVLNRSRGGFLTKGEQEWRLLNWCYKLTIYILPLFWEGRIHMTCKIA